MSDYKDGVSVFHFTSRISSAKIRKYTIATQRGMTAAGGKKGNHSQPLPTPAPQVAPAGTLHLAAPSNSASPAPSPSMEPPAKKPKLKLTVRDPSQIPAGTPGSTPSVPMILDGPNESITVSRPQREPRPLRFRYDENMVLDDESLRIHSDSSDLSEPDSPPPPPRSMYQQKQVKQPTPANPEYGDFMSYYVTGDDGDDKSKADAGPSSKAPTMSQQHPHAFYQNQPQHGAHHPQQHAPQQRRNPSQQSRRNNSARMQQPPPPPPVPTVLLVGFDIVNTPCDPNNPKTVAEMITKLEALSASLAAFAGIPPPQSPLQSQNHTVAVEEVPKKDDAAIESFLGMFEDGDESSSDDDAAAKEVTKKKQVEAKQQLPNLDYTLKDPGLSDGPLTYGIQFIQNALKSWAQARLNQYYVAKRDHEHNVMLQQFFHPNKRGPGRPKRLTEEEERMQQQVAQQPVVVHAENTPEGKAVECFREVISSGCLQVNAVLPQELTRALRNLYMQIDRLINQGSKNEPVWQCVSYGVQIAANKMRVDKWKESQAKAQDEMARQQHLAHQQVLQQMGLPPNHSQPLNEAQMRQAHDMELERRRSMAHAQQQPYLSQHHLNPMPVNLQPPNAPSGSAPPQNGVNESSAGKPSTPNSSMPTSNGLPHPQPQSPAISNSEEQKNHMEHVVMYQAGYKPQRGPQMKFSFAPSNEQQMQVWGPNAFPQASPQGPAIPNKCPMSGAPAQTTPSKTTSGNAVPSVVASIETNAPSATNKKAPAVQPAGTTINDGDVEMVDKVTPNNKKRKASSTEIKKEHFTPPVTAPAPTGGFTAVSKTMSNAASSNATSIGELSKQNGHNMAARYPHPGAIVVDR
ncbi:hypothetical protein LTR86_002100 [Recurvomyces mirabilis]|nr:hypothetical protein LTR86_002100 [Recurvomyces mirabilis]